MNKYLLSLIWLWGAGEGEQGPKGDQGEAGVDGVTVLMEKRRW